MKHRQRSLPRIPHPLPVMIQKKRIPVTISGSFLFPVMENVLKAARLLAPMYHGSNTLYKDEQEEMYLLALARSDHSAADFNRICNMLSEYGALERASGATFAFLEEHCKTFLSGDAVQQLANI